MYCSSENIPSVKIFKAQTFDIKDIKPLYLQSEKFWLEVVEYPTITELEPVWSLSACSRQHTFLLPITLCVQLF